MANPDSANDASFTLLLKLTFNENVTMKKILAALLLTLPTLAVAVDLEGYYITAKVACILKQGIQGWRTLIMRQENGALRTLER